MGRLSRSRWALLILVIAVLLGVGYLRLREQAVGAPVVTFLHFNDVYEIGAVAGGHSGGLARVATVRAQLLKSTAHLITTLGGDYLSPSAIGTARVDGQPLAGRQMVDVLNALGVDYATLGNHEFDVSESAFRQRTVESKFQLISTNVTDGHGKLFDGIGQAIVVPVAPFRAATEDRYLQLGIIGLTIDSNRLPWVNYAPPIDAAKRAIASFRAGPESAQVDAIIALTHLSLADDIALVNAVPDIDLVLGGHEHENWMIERGPHLTPIIKADANVRSVAIVTMTFGVAGARPTVTARLQVIDDTIAPDPKVDAAVKRWTTVAFDAFTRDGFTPGAAVATITAPLDGRESIVRNGSSALTDLITASLVRETGPVDAAIFNSGSIRIDDVLTPGPITEYDVIRVLPFGGKVLKATFDGALLASVLDAGVANKGSGGYLQAAGITRENNHWMVQGKPLNPAARYTIAIDDFLLTGGEVNLGFLTRTNPHVHDIEERRDIRQAMMAELRARSSSK
jgi:5'-nucleotidase